MIRPNAKSVLAGRIIIGALFCFSGYLKLIDLLQFSRSLASMKLPFLEESTLLFSTVSAAFPLYECLLGVALLVGIGRRGLLLQAAGVFAFFAILLASLIVRGIIVDCSCLGPLLSMKVSWLHVIIDAALAAFCFWCCLHRDSVAENTDHPIDAEAADA